MFNWQDLDRNDILHWMLPHLLAGHHNDGLTEKLSEATNKFQNIELKIVINGFEFDGAAALRELYSRMSESFDHAVSEKAAEVTQFMVVEDLMHDILKEAQRRVRTKLDDLGFPPEPEY